MKGLLIKELIMFKKSWKVTAILILIFSIYSINEDLSMCLILTLLCSAIPLGSSAHDEQSRWLQYSIAMPYGRKKYVSSKYLSQLLSLLFSMVIITVLWFISSVINGNFNMELLGVILWSACVAGLIYPMIIIPLTMAFSSSTSRLFFLILNGFIGGLGGMTVANDSFNNTVLTSKITSITPFVILAVVVAAYLLSWGLSIKIYEKRDL